MNKKIITDVVFAVIIGAGIYFLAATPTAPNGGGADVAFTNVAKDSHGGYGERGNVMVQSEVEWRDLWSKTTSNQTPPPQLPDVDFEKETLIAAFMGTERTGGYAIEITKITETDSALMVSVKEISPGPNCIVTMALTQPYHIVKILKTEKQVEFLITEEVTECSR